MNNIPEAIPAMIEQQLREAESQKRSDRAKAAWKRRKANPMPVKAAA
jgi:hypothetical protein